MSRRRRGIRAASPGPALALVLAALLPGLRCRGPYAGPFVVELRDLVVRYHPATAEPAGGGVARVCFALEIESRARVPLEVMLLAASTSPATRVVDASARFPRLAPGERVGSLDPICVEHDTTELFTERSLELLDLDRYFGWRAVESLATGRFRVEEIDGVWWFITPEGHGFYSIGVTGFDEVGDVSPALGTAPYRDHVLGRYGSREAWAEVAQDRFRAWGYNTVGGWSDPTLFRDRIPYMENGHFNTVAPAVPGVPVSFGKTMRDYFDPAFETGARDYAERFRDCAENPFCIGVYTDNEQPWGRSILQPTTYLEAYLGMAPGSPGKRAVQAFFEARYAGDIGAFNQVWGTELPDFDAIQGLDGLGGSIYTEAEARRQDRLAFLRTVSERYHWVVHDALRAVSPDLLILGSRFFGAVSNRGVVEVSAPFVDVVSVNNYDFDPVVRSAFFRDLLEGELLDHLFLDDAFSDLATMHRLTGRPVLVTEWFYRLRRGDSLPPFLPEVPDEASRVAAYTAYITRVAEMPFMLGTHWFQWQDQPEEGRSDEENQVIGLVDIHDDPHVPLVGRMAEVQGALLPLRAMLRGAPPGGAEGRSGGDAAR